MPIKAYPQAKERLWKATFSELNKYFFKHFIALFIYAIRYLIGAVYSLLVEFCK